MIPVKISLTSVDSEMTILITLAYGFRKKKAQLNASLQTILVEEEQDPCSTMAVHPLRP